MSVFLVDLRRAVELGQIEIRPIATMLNHHTTELFIQDLEVPAANLIGEEGMGFRYIIDGWNAERILIASESLGDGRWFVERAARYASERVVFGRPIGANQGVQFPIAQAHARLEAASSRVPRAPEASINTALPKSKWPGQVLAVCVSGCRAVAQAGFLEASAHDQELGVLAFGEGPRRNHAGSPSKDVRLIVVACAAAILGACASLREVSPFHRGASLGLRVIPRVGRLAPDSPPAWGFVGVAVQYDRGMPRTCWLT